MYIMNRKERILKKIEKVEFSIQYLKYYKENVINDIEMNCYEMLIHKSIEEQNKIILSLLNFTEYESVCDILKKYKNNLFNFESGILHEMKIEHMLNGEYHLLIIMSDELQIYIDYLSEKLKRLNKKIYSLKK